MKETEILEKIEKEEQDILNKVEQSDLAVVDEVLADIQKVRKNEHSN